MPPKPRAKPKAPKAKPRAKPKAKPKTQLQKQYQTVTVNLAAPKPRARRAPKPSGANNGVGPAPNIPPRMHPVYTGFGDSPWRKNDDRQLVPFQYLSAYQRQQSQVNPLAQQPLPPQVNPLQQQALPTQVNPLAQTVELTPDELHQSTRASARLANAAARNAAVAVGAPVVGRPPGRKNNPKVIGVAVTPEMQVQTAVPEQSDWLDDDDKI